MGAAATDFVCLIPDGFSLFRTVLRNQVSFCLASQVRLEVVRFCLAPPASGNLKFCWPFRAELLRCWLCKQNTNDRNENRITNVNTKTQNRLTSGVTFAAVMIAAAVLALHAALAQQVGTRRIDLQRHDLSVAGREVIQTIVELEPGTTAPRTRIQAKRSSMSSKARGNTRWRASRR